MKKFKVVYVEEVCNSNGIWALHRGVVEVFAKNEYDVEWKVRLSGKDPIHIDEM